MRFILVTFLIFGCGPIPDPFEKEPEQQDERNLFDEMYDRLGGFVKNVMIGTKSDGKVELNGEAVLWTAIAAGSLPCDKARPFMDVLVKMASENGYFERVIPIGEYKDRPINFDGMSGVYFGFSGYLGRCGPYPKLVEAWGRHRSYLDDSGGQLHPDYPGEKYPEVFDSVVRSIDHRLGLSNNPPTPEALWLVATAATKWTQAVVLSRSPCFRIHLSFLQILSLQATGNPISDRGRSAFCRATGKIGDPSRTAVDIPTIDHYCSREGLGEYLENYRVNEYEYRFQRCGLWETPDGKGRETAGLDYLVGYSEFYKARLHNGN